ncbi:MAG: hypothetical protein OHK0038_14750 [Flammeovirgaceae bacterium]
MALFIFIFFVCTLFFSFSHYNLRIDSVLEAIVINNKLMIEKSKNFDNLIHFNNLEPNILSFIKNLPVALWEGLARPYIWESGHLYKKGIAFERLVIVFTVFFAIYQIVKNPPQLKLQIKLLIFCNIVYCVTLLVMLSYSAPNIGTLNRYQTGFIPFLVFMCLCAFPEKYFDWNFIKNQFGK